MRKNPTPKLSVVIPTFNQPQFLPDCMARVLRQDYPNIEVIVVVDGHDPETELIAKDFESKNCRVTTILHEINQGVNAAINTGTLAASGEFICIVATDDPIKGSYFTTLVNFLIAFPNCPLVFSDGATYVEKNKTTVVHPLGLSSTQVFWNRDDFVKVMKRHRFHMNSNTIMYRRKILVRYGGYNPEFHEFADWFINLSIALNAGVGYIPKNFVATRSHFDAYHLRRKKLKRSHKTIGFVVKHIGENTSLETQMAFKTSRVFPLHNPYYFFKLRLDPFTAFFFKWETFLFVCGSFFWHRAVKNCCPLTFRPTLKRALLFVFSL